MHRMEDLAEVRVGLRLLRTALDRPELVERCLEKTTAESLYGFGRWLRWGRRCKVCRRQVVGLGVKYCGKRCRKRAFSWRRPTTRWQGFVRSVEKVIKVDPQLKPESYERFESLLSEGRIRAYRNRDGRLGAVGIPR
jgi:hypothetical protein